MCVMCAGVIFLPTMKNTALCQNILLKIYHTALECLYVVVGQIQVMSHMSLSEAQT